MYSLWKMKLNEGTQRVHFPLFPVRDALTNWRSWRIYDDERRVHATPSQEQDDEGIIKRYAYMKAQQKYQIKIKYWFLHMQKENTQKCYSHLD